MAAILSRTAASILLLLLIFSFSSGAKLNVPKVLLPFYSSVSTNFTLEVTEGCYTWKSSRPEIATVTPSKDGKFLDSEACSNQAIVTSVSKTGNKMTSIVIAEDPISGQQLRCDVIVDKIHSLYVETTTRELYLEDSPEQLIVRALDDEGNVFSSLEGMAFEWGLISDTDVEQDSIVDAHNILRILPFSESFYETPPYIARLENKGKQGDILLVDGIRTGSAKVNVRLADAQYRSVQEAIVRLIVIANIVLNPPLVYVMQHCVVQYNVQVFKQGNMQEIPMPSPQYYLEVIDGNVAVLDEKTSIVTANQLGYTDLVLKDKNIKVKEAFRKPTAGIYVVSPGYLGFVVLPGRKWVLETGREYEILVEIYDKDSRKIFPSDNIRIQLRTESKFFQVYTSTVNGTHHHVKALQSGTTNLEGLLATVIDASGNALEVKPPIRGTQDVEIYDNVKVQPGILAFPWHPARKHQYIYQLDATGGSGNYSWTSSETQVAAVNVRGTISTYGIGSSVITAADVRNNAHTDSMKVHVIPPSDMHFILSPVEAEIGEFLFLPLAMYGSLGESKQRILFGDCRAVPFIVHVKDQSVFTHISDEDFSLVDGSCTIIKVKAQKQGHTEIMVTYNQDNIRLSASVTIAAYKLLRPISPENVAVVAVGSSKEIMLTGGPQPWILDSSKYYETLTPDNLQLVTYQGIRGFGDQKNYHTFLIVCQNLGEQDLEVEIGNGKTSKNQWPASSKATVRFACAEPTGLHLVPVLKMPEDLPPCPVVPDSPEAVPVANYKDLSIVVTVTDSSGRKFDNFSSLVFQWDLSDYTLATFKRKDAIMSQDIVTSQTGSKYLIMHQNLNMLEKTGALTLNAMITGYSIGKVSLEHALTASLDLLPVNKHSILPDRATVFNHPSNKVSLQIEGGSGYFHHEQGNSQVAAIGYNRQAKSLQVVPNREGTLLLKVYDLCIDVGPHVPQAEVVVAGANTIFLSVVDKVQQHKKIVAKVSVLDKTGQPLPASYFEMMDLQPIIGKDFIKVSPRSKNIDEYTKEYVVEGVALGTTALKFTAKPPSGPIVSSVAKSIQVFPPLRLEPRNITLIIGATFQVNAYGGPQPQSTIEFSIEKSNIAGISNAGLLNALSLGSTTVKGRAIGYDDDRGTQIVYSEDEVTVYVIMLEGVRIFAPLQRLETGTKMPLYALGMNEHETPFTFGIAEPPLIFKWTLNNRKSATLKSVYHRSGITLPDDNNFAMQLYALQAGHVTIGLTVYPSPGSESQILGNITLHDEIQIHVFEKLTLIGPVKCTENILISTNTETRVKTNRDGAGRMSYEVIEDAMLGSEPIVTVSSSGVVRSFSNHGYASIRVIVHEDFGVNQTLIVGVEVKEVSYLMINSVDEINTGSESLKAVPLGTTLHFVVSHHDDVGQMFHMNNMDLKMRQNRYDLVHISQGSRNGSLIAKTSSIGQTTLKVWDANNPRIADYINIRVGHAVEPAEAKILLGDVICFSSPMLTETGTPGHWSSNNQNIPISHSGIGTASHVGSAQIAYEVSTNLVTSTEITILPVEWLSLDTDDVLFLTNTAENKKPVVIPVLLGGREHGIIQGTNCSEKIAENGFSPRQIPYRCILKLTSHHNDFNIDDLLQIKAVFNHVIGRYECVISGAQRSHELYQIVSSLDTSIELHAEIPARDGQDRVESPSVVLPFKPAFYVHSSDIYISDLNTEVDLVVSLASSLQNDLKAISSDPSIITVSDLRYKEEDKTGTFQIKLTPKQHIWEMSKLEVNVDISCRSSGQTQSVPVRIRLIGAKPKGSREQLQAFGWAAFFQAIIDNYHTLFLYIICILVTGAALLIAYHSLSNARYAAGSGQSVFLSAGQAMSSPPSFQQPSPWNSPYSVGGSPGKVPLWTSMYDNTDTSGLRSRSPTNRSPSPFS